MDKLKKRLANLTIRQSLLRVTLLGTLIAGILILLFLIAWNAFASLWADKVIYAHWTVLGFSAHTLSIAFYFGIDILVSMLILILVMRQTVSLFYENKLAQPIKQLNYGITQIKAQNLDFKLQNQNQDELGELTRSFSLMQAALKTSLQQNWQLLEDQKEVNAAFAHDLRTPLTVLQGDIEMLTLDSENSADTQILLQDLQNQLTRVKDFVTLMNKITSLQNATDVYDDCTIDHLVHLIKNESSTIFSVLRTNFAIQNHSKYSHSIKISTAAVLEVLDNQLNNAKRFAQTMVSITLKITDQDIKIQVFNDGPHLSPTELKNARTPFFSKTKSSSHLGVGMYICKVICNTHGGEFSIKNTPKGVLTTSSFNFNQ
jgi:signal transduction histidine kinase